MSALRVNLLYVDDGRGHSRDAEVLAPILQAAGFDVTRSARPFEAKDATRRARVLRALGRTRERLMGGKARFSAASGPPEFDLNLHMEGIVPAAFGRARVNCLVPNQEWWPKANARSLGGIDLVLAKTRHAEAIFQELGRRTAFVAFTSTDNRDGAGVEHTQLRFFHLGRRGNQKNTPLVVETWARHPGWPPLTVVDGRPRWRELGAKNVTVVGGYPSDAEIRALENGHSVHLVPSESEGYGHRIGEALSVGALCLTTDAPPMNELVTPERGVLVATRGSEPQGIGTKFHLDAADFERQVERIIAMPASERAALGAAGRAWFDENAEVFPTRFATALREAATLR